MEISGERRMGPEDITRAIFVRDPDRNVLEFERNLGAMKDVEHFTASMIGDARPMDHVGTRVVDPAKSWLWYAKSLGFVDEVMHYEHSKEDPLKNFCPWISRTEATTTSASTSSATTDINLIINSNMPGRKNALIEGGVLKPGILYAGLLVEDLQASTAALRKSGVTVFTDDEVSSLGLKKDKLPTIDGGSIFVADPDRNLFRLL